MAAPRLTLLLMALLLVSAALLTHPSRLVADCICADWGSTNIYQGSGSSCVIATGDARSQAYNEAPGDCAVMGDGSVCYHSLLYVTSSCQFDSSTGAY